MKVTKSALARLKTDFAGYIEGRRVDEFLAAFGIRFAAGHWAAGDFCDRFAPPGYNSDDRGFSSDILDQLDRVKAAGIEGVEFHENVFLDPRTGEVDRSRVKAVKDKLRETGLRPTNMNTNTWTEPKWKLGGVTNPDPKVRRDAVAKTVRGVAIAKEIGCSSVALWPGSDGWDYNFEVNYGRQIDWFIDACVEVNTAAKRAGLVFGVEAKLHEPREGNMVIPTTQAAALVAKEVNSECGGSNMGVAVDYGHEQMYAVEPAYSVYLLKRIGVPLVNFHVNNAKLHSNDEDRVTGTGDVWRLADFCYAAVDTGYQGWFGEDQFTYRMEPVKAMTLSRELFANVMKKALLIYAHKDELERARATGDAGATIDAVKRVIL
jgi:xylose isomerase